MINNEILSTKSHTLSTLSFLATFLSFLPSFQKDDTFLKVTMKAKAINNQ